MAFYVFTSDLEGWSGSGFSWTGADGYPDFGCAVKTGSFGTALFSITGLSIPVSANDNLEAYLKYSGTLSSIGGGYVRLRARDGSNNILAEIGLTAGISPPDTWINVITVFPGNSTVVTLEVKLGGSGNSITSLSVDSVYVVDVPTPHPSPGDDTRIAGINADNAYFYRTEILGGYNYLQYYEFGGTSPAGTVLFNQTDYNDLDDFTGGLYPVINYGRDKQIYLRGVDANGIVLFADLNGTLGFSDVGGGTAWAGKFCSALLIDPLSPTDIVAIFYDNDVYRTTGGIINWGTKFGDVTGQIATASRNPTSPLNIMAGAAGGGSIFYSGNSGQTFTSGGTIAGTPRWIEFSQ